MAILGICVWKFAGVATGIKNQVNLPDPLIVAAGDTVALKDDSPWNYVAGSDGTAHHFDFGWTGEMDVSVLSSASYPTVESLDQDVPSQLAEDMHRRNDAGDGITGLLLVKVRVRNVSASPTRKNDAGAPVFDASCMFYVPPGSEDTRDYWAGTDFAYFSGTTVAEGDHDYLKFTLEAGEEKEYVLGYWYGIYGWEGAELVAEGPGAPPEVMLPGPDGCRGTYVLNLDTVDKSGGAL